jgi:hypothetical protein
MILDDPALDGVGAVLFDEFHERSLDADLGLALARDAQQGLREDLRILVMSATIDGARRDAAWRRAGDRKPGPCLPGRDPLRRTRRCGRSSRKWPTPSRARCAPKRDRCLHSCLASLKSAAPGPSSKAAPMRRPMW